MQTRDTHPPMPMTKQKQRPCGCWVAGKAGPRSPCTLPAVGSLCLSAAVLGPSSYSAPNTAPTWLPALLLSVLRGRGSQHSPLLPGQGCSESYGLARRLCSFLGSPTCALHLTSLQPWQMCFLTNCPSPANSWRRTWMLRQSNPFHWVPGVLSFRAFLEIEAAHIDGALL